KNYGVEIVQSVFAGGRLLRTFHQSRENLEAGRSRLIKTEQETIYRARESFWNLVQAQKISEVYARARKDLEKEKDMADRLLQNDVITAQVYMTINAQVQQVLYQNEFAEADLELRLWQWTQAMGLKSPPLSRPG